MSRFRSELLGAAHDRGGFSSGNAKIDAYFRTGVSQDVRRRYALCYVLIENASDRIAGFHTLSSSNIPLVDLPPEMARKLPRYPTIPAVLIGWLGRAIGFRGQSVGSMLLFDAIARVASSPVGAHALFAEAIDDNAAAFYRAHGFTPLPTRPRCLFLPIATAVTLVPPGGS